MYVSHFHQSINYMRERESKNKKPLHLDYKFFFMDDDDDIMIQDATKTVQKQQQHEYVILIFFCVQLKTFE